MKLRIALLALFASCTPVMAQEPAQCWERQDFLNQMRQHEASTVGYGLNHVNLLTEVWVRGDREWLLTVTGPNMITCLATYGVAWQDGHILKQGVPG